MIGFKVILEQDLLKSKSNVNGINYFLLKRIETYPDLKRKRQACKEQTESGTDQTLLGPLEGG